MAPYLYGNTFHGGDFGVLSENSRPVLRLNKIETTRLAGVFALGPNVPELGGEGRPGNNSFDSNQDFAFANQSRTQVSAFGNYWQSSSSERLDSHSAIDQVILDDDENSAAGAVDFSGFLLYEPPLITHKGDVTANNLVDSEDFQALLKAWHSIIGEHSKFNPRLDFDGNRIYHSTLIVNLNEIFCTDLPMRMKCVYTFM